MCTVTYIPRGNNQFVLTSNRDENPGRSTSSVNLLTTGMEKVLFPVDPVAGGSWIAASYSAKVACILNGAFERHQRSLPYRKSRGLVLLDYFRSESAEQFINRYNFENIEPFTMVIYDQEKLVEFRWDGTQKYRQDLNINSPHIWSSTTLYDIKTRSRREEWFADWLKDNRKPRIKDLFTFHRFGGEKDPQNGLVMNRDDQVQTLSITSVEKNNKSVKLFHYDLIKDRVTKRHIDFTDETMESHKVQ